MIVRKLTKSESKRFTQHLHIQDDIEQVLELLDEVIEFEKDKHLRQLVQSSINELESVIKSIDILD